MLAARDRVSLISVYTIYIYIYTSERKRGNKSYTISKGNARERETGGRGEKMGEKYVKL